MNQSTTLALLTFAAAASAVVAVASILSDLFLRDRTRVSRRIDDEFRQNQRRRAERSGLFKNLDQLVAEAAGERPPLRRRLETMIDQAGMELGVERLGAYSLVAAAVGAGLGLLSGRGPGVAAGAAAIGGALPLLYVHFRRNRRQDRLRAQLSDAFDLMARVVRAGQTIAQAQQAVADEFEPPIAEEFSYCYEQQNLGLPPEVALRELARRTGLLEISIFVTALLVQQQSGGNLSELLENLATVVRERFRIRGKIRALTAEGRFQGLILLMLPAGLYLIMLALNPEFAGVLLEYPQLLIAVGISEAFGALWMRKIVNFDF